MNSQSLIGAILLAAAVGLSGCSNPAAQAAPPGPQPVQLAPVPGTNLKKVTLSDAALRRLHLRTAVVTAAPAAAGSPGRTVVPYAALIYDDAGKTWTFVAQSGRTFLRAPVTVAAIKADRAVLSRGPVVGTTVVTTGAEELLGAEYEISGE